MHTVDLEFNDENSLIDALKECGYKVEVHENEVEIKPYYQERESQKAHIVVRKKEFHGFTDAGFQRLPDGTYKLHLDEMDWDGRTGKFDVNKIKRKYGLSKIKKIIKNSSKYSIIEEKESNEEINIRLKIREFE